MPVLALDDGRRSWRHITPSVAILRFSAWLALAALTVWCWRVMTQDTIWAFVESAPQQAADIFGRMLPPRWSYAQRLWRPLWDTINIATLGTLLAIILASPIAFLAARNTTPSVVLVRPVALLVIVASRSINALVWGLLLVAILGPGVFAGIIAIALRSIGFVGKLLYEAIEEIDESQVEAIRATGASPLRSWPTASCRRSSRCLHRSACSAGTSMCANRPCSVSWGRVGSAWHSNPRSTCWPGRR